MQPQARQRQLLELAGPCRSQAADGLQPLLAALTEIYGEALAAVVFYGSCLRSGDLYAGLIDFYVIVDSYRRAHRSRLSALFNALLPPNVYYLERPGAHGRLRAKYAVLSIGQLERGAGRWFQSSIWGRFAQPVALEYVRSPELAERVRAACGEAVVSLLRRALPALPQRQYPAAAYGGALALSYGGELRVESTARAADLVADNAREYRRRLLATSGLLPFSLRRDAGDTVVCTASGARRTVARASWPLRRALGKLLSVLRLVKACFTFSDAVDYAAWKLQRHTGVEIAVTPRLRRYPLIFGWGLLWRLYRRRALR